MNMKKKGLPEIAFLDVLPTACGEDSYGAGCLVRSLRWVPASQISLTAPHLHRLHIGPVRP